MDKYFYATSLAAYAIVAVLCGCYGAYFRKISSERVRIVTANMALFLFLAATAFIAGETYYRFVYDESDSMNITLTSLKWYKKHFRYNNFGLRDNVDYALQAPADRPRISFLGDSFTAGAGINDVEERFVNIIRKETPWDVQSLATCGDDTLTELKVVEKLAASGYQTDLYILVYNLNDATDMSDDGRSAMRRIIANYESSSILRNRSYFIDTMYYRYKRQHDQQVKNHFYLLPNDYQGENLERMTSALLRLNKLVRDRGAKLLVVIFPLVHAIDKENPYPYQAIHKQMNDLLQENSIPHMDLLAPLLQYRDRKLTANRYDGHPNEFAHRLAAEHIRNFIAQQLHRVDK